MSIYQTPQGLPRAGGSIFPSMQLYGSTNYADAVYPNAPQAFTQENWKDSGFYHSVVTNPSQFQVAQAGRYQINIDYNQSSDSDNDLFYEISYDAGANWAEFLRITPMNTGGTPYEGSVTDLLLLTGKEIMQIRVYHDSPSGSRTIDTTLTLMLMNKAR